MEIRSSDIYEYLQHNSYVYDKDTLEGLIEIYKIDPTTNYGKSQIYIIDKLSKNHILEKERLESIYKRRKDILNELKQLELPEQRSPEWYEMRKEMLTASSMASALDKCHFTTRDELLLGKIVPKPYETNPITEWGVKYEDVAIQVYEELYNVKVLDFGLIPHHEFKAFGASPDGICDDTGNDEYVGRMVEIKCPPKRKFTKTVPGHYLMQVLGQLEVCNLDECDFFQVKIEEYESYEDYQKDVFINDDTIVEGRTEHNFPKGVTLTYKINEVLSYKYCQLNQTNQQLQSWIQSQPTENLFETKWWKITRYETTLVKRDHQWWIDKIEDIGKFYKDLLYYKEGTNVEILKQRVLESKKRKRKFENKPVEEFLLVSDEEDNQ
jgi:putative phage-type endonuclease